MKVSNMTALKVKYFGPTGKRGSRIKFSQLNNEKTKTIEFESVYTGVLDQVEAILNRIGVNWCVIVDNTQNDYYLIGIFSEKGYNFPSVIELI